MIGRTNTVKKLRGIACALAALLITAVFAVLPASFNAKAIDGTNQNEPGLVGWWKMNEGAGTYCQDFSGNGNHAWMSKALYENSGWQTDATFGNVIAFNGSYQSLRVIVPIGFDVPEEVENVYDVVGGFSVAAWVKTPADTSDDDFRADYRAIISKGLKVEGHFEFILDKHTGGLALWSPELKDSDGENENFRSTVSVNDGSWHQVGVATDNESFVKYYVDGVKVAEYELTAGDLFFDERMYIYIGSLVDEAFTFLGNILDVRLYNIVVDDGGYSDLFNNQKPVKKTDKTVFIPDTEMPDPDPNGDDDEKKDDETGCGSAAGALIAVITLAGAAALKMLGV